MRATAGPQSRLCRALGQALHRPAWLAAPAGLLRLLLGELAELLLDGQRAVPRRLLQAGFRFRFTTLEEALADLLAGTDKD